MLSTLVVGALSALMPVVVAAQLPDLPFNLTYTPDLSKVDLSTKAAWCRGETAVCDTLCGAPNKYPKTNSCTANPLSYACTCQNGTAPGLQYYKNSLPTFVCQEAFSQCIDANVGNSTGQEYCQKTIRSQCGTLDASSASVSGSSSATASSTPSATQSGSSTATASATPHSVAASIQMPHYAGVAAAAALLCVVAL